MQDVFETDRDRLAALQAIDTRIKEKRDLIAVLVAEVDEFKAQIFRYRADVTRLTTERGGLESQRREFESRLEAEEAKIKGNRMRMSRVRNERELLALKHEVTVTKEANQQIEEHVIALMVQLEELEKQVAAAAQSFAELEGRSKEFLGSREGRIAALNEEIAAEKEGREQLASGLSSGLRGKYEQIFERRGGTAVVEVRNGTCLGCHMHVPPQLYNELQKTREVRQCQNCHRILFWRPNVSVEAQQG